MKFLFKLRYVPAILFAIMAAPVAHAATSPGLGTAASFSVLGKTLISDVPVSTISGDVGLDNAGTNYSGLTSPEVAGTIYDTNGTGPDGSTGNNPALTISSRSDETTAYGQLSTGVNATCTDLNYQFGAGNKDLAGKTLVPGVYCADTFSLSGTLTLDDTGGSGGVWVFRSAATLITSAGGVAHVVFLHGTGLACNVWWKVVSSATIDTGTTFIGNILALTAISMNTGATLNGRAFAQNAAVTLQSNTISGPTCTTAPPPSSTSSPLTPPLINLRKVPSPLALPAGPGPVTYTYTVTNPGKIPIHDVTLTDDKCSNVTYVSGDTNGDLLLDIFETWTYTCTTTLTATTVNYATVRGIGNDMAAVDTAIAEVVVGVPVVPPLIHIIKTPNQLTLSSGGGSVTYGYTVHNPGTVPLTGVTVTDDKCSGVTYVSGDANGDLKLQAGEEWKYTCTTNVPLTTTNTAVATGHANGLTAIDTALATVVVAGSPVPPLIHIIKKPVPIILPSGGGVVTYTYTVTNPGTVPLNNVSVTDDKCGTVTFVSGDANGNGLMETTETWTYTCQQNLKATTTNTATAKGSANGLTVTDISVASVVLSPALIPPAPKLPNTGFEPGNGSAAWLVGSAGIFVVATLLFALKRKRLF